MKLKDYPMPQYGLDEGLDQEDLKQYSLKNFDLKAHQLTQQQPDADPIPAPCDPYPLHQETDCPSPLPPAREAPPPDPLYLNPVQTELNQPALNPYDVQFGPHFNLQTVSYNPLSPAEQWKLPRWVVTMVGLFFGSAAVLALAFCVALLRDPKAPPAAQLAVPTAPLATTSAAPAQPGSSAPNNKPRAASAPVQETTTKGEPAARVAVASRHPAVVRRQIYSPRRVASKSTSSSVATQDTETASRPTPQDALDKLLNESSL